MGRPDAADTKIGDRIVYLQKRRGELQELLAMSDRVALFWTAELTKMNKEIRELYEALEQKSRRARFQ